MLYRVVFAPEAQTQLLELYRHIEVAASPMIAERYTHAIITYCESFEQFPLRGTRRDDIRKGLRITNYKKRAVIAFDVDGDCVSILGIYYGGQDYEAVLQDENDA